MDENLDIEVFCETLPNRLRLVHHYSPDTAMVALDVMYHAGARNERPDMTGIAHLFEHIMFGGSANVSDFDGVLTAAGGVSNAWTGNDFTNFFEIAPAHNAETLFYLESDRMLAPAISDSSLEIQRSVVIEEFKQQCLNAPYGNMTHTLRKMVYGDHPYSWPVIGKDFESLERVTRQDIIDWWTDNYSTGHAVLAVSGNITFEETRRLAYKWFAGIPYRELPPRSFSKVADLVARDTRSVYGAVPATLVTVAYLMDQYGTLDYYAADAITDILSAGQASRFFQRITMNPDAPVVEADASITGAEDRGMLMLTARLANEDVDPEEAAEYLIAAARSIITEGVTEHELQRIKNRQRSIFVMSNMSCLTCAQTIAEAAMHFHAPGWPLFVYSTLTTDDIERVARDIFDNSHPAVLFYRPLGADTTATLTD